MKTNAGELTNVALSILMEGFLLALTVPFFTGRWTWAAVIPPTSWGWRGLFVWAGVCPCFPAARRCAALKSHYLHQFYAPTNWCVDTDCSREPFLLEGTESGSGLCWRGRRDGARLVPTSSSPHPSLCWTQPSAFLVPGSCPCSALLPKAKLPRVSPVPGPVPGHRARC